MSKFRHHVTIGGGTCKAPAVYVSGPRTLTTTTCKHIADSAWTSGAFVRGMLAFDFYPDLREVMSRIESDGIKADWEKVGSDLRHAMATLPAAAAAKRERAA